MDVMLGKLQAIWDLGLWPQYGGWSHTGETVPSWVSSNGWGKNWTSKHLSAWTEAVIVAFTSFESCNLHPSLKTKSQQLFCLLLKNISQ